MSEAQEYALPNMAHTIDYAEVGLIAGLEVHQQLLTPTKMFCRCPAGRYTDTHDGASPPEETSSSP